MRTNFPSLASVLDAKVYMIGQTLETQESITGVDTITPTMRGRWKADFVFSFRGDDADVEWQGFLAQMDGRTGTVRVPVSGYRRPRDRLGRPLPFCPDVAAPSPPSRVVVAATAPLRSTSLQLDVLDTTGLRPGHFFSIGDRLYRVRTSIESSSRAEVTFTPPLRAAALAGTHVEIDRPTCLMRFATDEEGSNGSRGTAPFQATVSFVEAT